MTSAPESYPIHPAITTVKDRAVRSHLNALMMLCQSSLVLDEVLTANYVFTIFGALRNTLDQNSPRRANRALSYYLIHEMHRSGYAPYGLEMDKDSCDHPEHVRQDELSRAYVDAATRADTEAASLVLSAAHNAAVRHFTPDVLADSTEPATAEEAGDYAEVTTMVFGTVLFLNGFIHRSVQLAREEGILPDPD